MLRRICNVLSMIILIVLLAVAGVLLLPTLFGYKSFAVLSGSMMPEIKVGEIVFVKQTEASKLKVGDVITYRLSDSARVTHRIVEIDEEQQKVLTKGDANETMDGTPISFDNIVGRVVVHVPFLGYISIYARTPLGIVIICGAAVMLIILNFLPEFFYGSREKRTV